MADGTSFDYTGVTANDYEIVGWNPGFVNVNPGAAGALGVAEQFTITQPTDISALDTSVLVYPNSPLAPSTTLTWDLYSGTTFEKLGGDTTSNLIPLVSSLILQSAPLTYPADPTANQTVTDQLAFNVDLQPGTYWIAQQGVNGGGVAVDPSQTYIDPPPGAVATPEPSTWILLFIGLVLFMLFKIRKLYPGIIDSFWNHS